MIRFVPLILVLIGFLLVWFIKPSWTTLIVVTLILAFLAWRFPPGKKNYD